MLARNLAWSDAKFSCLDNQHASKFRSELGISEREISVYCGCVSEPTAASATTDELTYIVTNGGAAAVARAGCSTWATVQTPT
jgi:hypothetical protein